MERKKTINNAFYDSLDAMWHTAQNHPIALLRAENNVRNPWILQTIYQKKQTASQILDIGCGAGLLSHALAEKGHFVTGIDLSLGSLKVAKRQNTGATFLMAPAENIPFPDSYFDVVCAMDLLEHVNDPNQVIQEASRVLKPGGLFFFHTFNRNWLSYLIIIKGVEWFVQNAPANMHVYSLFIKPKELTQMLTHSNLTLENIQGLIPNAKTKAFWNMILFKTIDKDFQFKFSKSPHTGYVGFAKKNISTK